MKDFPQFWVDGKRTDATAALKWLDALTKADELNPGPVKGWAHTILSLARAMAEEVARLRLSKSRPAPGVRPTAEEVNAEPMRIWWVRGSPVHLTVDRRSGRVMWGLHRFVDEMPAADFGGKVLTPEEVAEHVEAARAEGPRDVAV